MNLIKNILMLVLTAIILYYSLILFIVVITVALIARLISTAFNNKGYSSIKEE